MQPHSPAIAENSPAPTQGNSPAPADTHQTTTQTLPADPLASDDIDALTALLDQSGDVNFEGQTERKKWQVGLHNETSRDPFEIFGENAALKAEAKPGEEGEAQTEEPTEQTEEAEEQAEDQRADALPKREPNNVRLKRDRFGADVQPIIDLMAAERTLSFDEAKAKLIAEGRLAEAPAPKAEAKAPAPEAAPASADIATQEAIIAGLESKLTDAALAYDQKEITRLTIEHNKALAALGKLELKAEQQAEAHKATQAERQAALEAGIAKSEAAALAAYPEVGKAGSDHYEAVLDWQEDPANAELLNRPDWPLLAAAITGAALGKTSAAPAAAPAKKVSPVLVPKRPTRSVPSPASGSTAGEAVKTAAPTLKQQIDEADAAGDIEKLSKLMEVASSRHSVAA